MDLQLWVGSLIKMYKTIMSQNLTGHKKIYLTVALRKCSFIIFKHLKRYLGDLISANTNVFQKHFLIFKYFYNVSFKKIS